MKTRELVVAVILATAGAACHASDAVEQSLRQLTAEKPGSPYHWVGDAMEGGTGYERVLEGKPGPSVADDKLKHDVLTSIGKAESTFGASGIPSLVEVRPLNKTGETYEEIWVVRRDKQNIAYTVFLTASKSGGVDIGIKGPWD